MMLHDGMCAQRSPWELIAECNFVIQATVHEQVIRLGLSLKFAATCRRDVCNTVVR